MRRWFVNLQNDIPPTTIVIVNQNRNKMKIKLISKIIKISAL